jgi:2-succinyl-6-hydroxy-2,4-cyclohexadiene-1-carboxylate synthase
MSPRRYAFGTALDDLAMILAELGIERAAWLGYSMGGRLALGMGIRHADLVSALVLESATPGIADVAQRASRRDDDEALACRIERDGVPAFVAEWEQRPLWATQRALSSRVRERQRRLRLLNRPRGLANSLRRMGQGAQPSYWDRLGAVESPALLLAGSEDAKFAGIAADMRALMPRATLSLVPEVGHAVHLESPGFYCDNVLAFLARSSDLATAHR